MRDREYMALAIEKACIASENGDVPVGAIIVKDGEVISEGYNKREKETNALMHAEICAIDEACRKLSVWRLKGTVMYVTLEPCPMCAGAIINSRIDRVVFGAYDEKAGCFGSADDFNKKNFNHRVHIVGGFMEKECSNLLTDFFEEKR